MHLSSTVLVILTLAAYYLFSAAVGAMLPPLPGQERTAYGWLYRFLQTVAANADRVAEHLARARFGEGLVPPPLPWPDSTVPLGPGAAGTTVERVEASSTTTYAVQPQGEHSHVVQPHHHL